MWIRQRPSRSPSARYGTSFAYHPPTKTIVLFGGVIATRGIHLGDTWLWNGRTWSVIPAGGPRPRWHAVMAFDPVSNGLILFGGWGDEPLPLRDTWKWDGTSWQALSPDSSPPHTGAGFAYSAAVGKLIMFVAMLVGFPRIPGLGTAGRGQKLRSGRRRQNAPSPPWQPTRQAS